MTADQTSQPHYERPPRSTLADFKSWWTSASADDQQRWWASFLDCLDELDAYRESGVEPWQASARERALEEENARLRAELEEAKAPKEGTSSTGISLSTSFVKPLGIDPRTAADRIIKSMRDAERAEPKPKPRLATSLADLFNGPGTPVVIFNTVRGDDDPGSSGQPAKPVPPCGNPDCQGFHLPPEVQRLFLRDVRALPEDRARVVVDWLASLGINPYV